MSASKVAKTIVFTAQSHELHTSIKLRNVLKWLKAGHEVRVRITGREDRRKAMEDTYKLLEKDIKSGARFLQKVVKPESIKVTLMPTEEAANLKVDEENDTVVDVEKELNEITSDQDIFSEDFEKTLQKSIRDELRRNKKK